MNIRIGTFNYNFEEVIEPIIRNFNQCDGEIDYRNLTISIDGKLTHQKKVRTLMHEIFHGMIKEYNIDIGELDEEYLVDNLGIATYQVIKDNSKLIDYIRKVN